MSFSKTLDAGQRRDIGRKEEPWSLGLPGLGKDDRVLPYCWEVGVLIEQVVEVSKIMNTPLLELISLINFFVIALIH